MPMSLETRTSARNVLTLHPPESYPGLLVVKGAPQWQVWVIVPEDGQTILASGGEKVYAYDTVDGGHAEGWELRRGDRATLVRSGQPHGFAVWRIERSPETVS